MKARIVGVPAEYPFGSAARYAHSGPRPRWLTRERIELDVMGGEDGAVYRPQRYQEVFGDPPTEQEIEIVERRMLHPCGAPDPLDDLLGAAPETVRAWQRRKCLLADGTRPGLPIVTPGTVLDLVAANADLSRKSRPVLTAGLMRVECGLGLREIGERTGCSEATALRRARRHSVALAEDAGYADAAARILTDALSRDHPADWSRRRPRSRSVTLSDGKSCSLRRVVGEAGCPK